MLMSILIPARTTIAQDSDRADVPLAPASVTNINSDPIEVLTGSNIYALKIDLRDPRVHARVLLANNGTGGRQTLQSIKGQIEGRGYANWALINGDYFSYTPPNPCLANASVNCAQGLTHIDGQKKENWSVYGPTWEVRGNIGFDSNNGVEISVGRSQTRQHMVIAGGPRVLMGGGSPTCRAQSQNGKVYFPDSGEYFDPDAIRYCNDGLTVSAIGYSGDGRYLFMGVASNTSITSFAQWLKDRGAHEVLKLDGGGSSGIYYDGAVRKGSSTGREIANAFAIVVDAAAPNQPPRTPAPLSPSDWHVQRDGRAPTLCWNNPGDPDGDGVVFYAEVYGSARNANSGWINNTCWRPSDLDGGYYGYQWRVKTKDSRGAESSWSGTWHFNIEQENRPPTISFNSANGNGASEIASRDQTWTFQGSASDPEGQLRELKFHCHGDACNEDPTIGLNSNWSHQRSSLTGRNEIWFTACDDRQCVDSRHVLLRVDLAAPTTTADANGQINPPNWFREPVNVTLRAQDGATANARVGVRELRYRVDGGGWQIHGGDTKVVSVTGDGNHTVEYYAVDQLDNQEGVKRIAFKIDATPPNPPYSASETHGVVSGQWQKSQGVPQFIWGAAGDATSGLFQVELYFGTDPNGADVQAMIGANAEQRWTPQPGGVRTGAYYLRGRSLDNAGNYSAWTTLFVYRYDVTAPANPTSATHAAAIANDTWQRTTRSANFTWPSAADEGSGVKGYFTYWGTDADGTATDFGAVASLQSTTPLCAATAACIGYLRVRSSDNVDNLATGWSTLFTLRYDGAPPTTTLSFNGGVTQTAQTQVTLNLVADDQGSGVQAMRFSNDGVAWTAWETYAAERLWLIPAIGRQTWPVYVQVRDVVGNESPVVMREIYLEVNREQPRSEAYRMFDYAMSAGAGVHESASYKARSTVGEVVESARVMSTQYQILGGYQAGSQAIPLVIPGHDSFTYINGVFASGIVATTMQSGAYQMIATVGEVALPNNVTTIASSSFRHQPGFLAAQPAVVETSTPEPPPPGPTPTPEPPPACEFPTISIDNAATFTGDLEVTLSLCAPRAAQMLISNDGGFGGTTWEPFVTTKPWTLVGHGQNVLPRYVYAAFKDSHGVIQSTFFDDIIYDSTAPDGQIIVGSPIPSAALAQAGVGLRAAANAAFALGEITYIQRLGENFLSAPAPLLRATGADGVDLYLIAQDDNSGMEKMQLSESGNFTEATWQPYAGLIEWTSTGSDGLKTVYARFQDSAGNISAGFSGSYVLDTHPPLGTIDILESIIGVDTTTVQIFFSFEDAVSGVTAMRVSEDPTFADAPWQTPATNLSWPIQVQPDDLETAVYVQFRDLAGNISQTYSDLLLVDREPPVVFAEAESAQTQERTVHIYAYDGLTSIQTLRMTNDPLLIQGTVTLPFTETVKWTFDERNVVWVQVADAVGNWSAPYPAYAAPEADVQSMALNMGWNFFSLQVEPATPAIDQALTSIAGRFDRIWTDTAFYSTAVPPQDNTLTALHGGLGYYLRAIGATAPTLQLVGQRLPVDTPLTLQAGWNLIGYMPDQPLPVATALQSISGQYGLVLSINQTYDPLQPEFSTLTTLEPGQGYLIWMKAPGVLVYPAAGAADEQAVKQSVSSVCAVSPTPQFTLVYGIVQINGVPAPAGTVVQATNAAGQVTGCGVVGEAGRLGYTHVFGVQDEGDVGMAPGELITWRVSGIDAQAAPALAWQNDRSGHSLDFGVTANRTYLPIIGKQ